VGNISDMNAIVCAFDSNRAVSMSLASVKSRLVCQTFVTGSPGNNNDRLTAFDPGQPG